MAAIRFTKQAVAFILTAARNTYPDEFIALLRKDGKGIVSEVVVVPLSVYGDGFSSVDFNMLPLASGVCGSVHSHPEPDNLPSQEDLLFFSRLRGVHAIVGYPYRKQDIAAYDERGKRLEIEIVGSQRKQKAQATKKSKKRTREQKAEKKQKSKKKVIKGARK